MSFNIIYLIMYRSCGQQHVGETGQSFHLSVNGHRFDIVHRRTDESFLSERLSGGPHSLADMLVLVIERARNLDPLVDYDPGNIVPSWHKSQGGDSL